MRSSALAAVAAALLMPLSVHAAALTLDPSGGTYGPGDTFIATVRIDPQGQCINAAEVQVSYPSDELRAIDVGRGDSIFSLWIDAPQIDAQNGLITFEGGIPGGYCGVIPGDPGNTDILGDIAFTVLKTDAKVASIGFTPQTAVYLNDGLGTLAKLTTVGAAYTLVPDATRDSNPWLEELQNDTTQPEPFTVQVESTKGVFDGQYYAVFSTVDKQSGIDHYEILENGIWKRVTSPYVLADQTLKSGVEIKAVDKEGNERVGYYSASSTPPRVGTTSLGDIWLPLLLLALLVAAKLFWDRRSKRGTPSGP